MRCMPAVGGDIPNATVSPIFSAFHTNLSSFPDAGRAVALQASLAIDGQEAAQQSALSISTFAYFEEVDLNGLVISGGTIGTGRTFGDPRIRRIGSGLSSAQDELGNAFFGGVTTMGFALSSDRFPNRAHQASLGGERGHSFNAQADFTAVDFLAGAVRTAAPADLGSMRSLPLDEPPSKPLNGYAAGIMESRLFADLQFTDFAFGNVDNDPTDVKIETDPDTNRLEATFNVRDVASAAASDIYVISFGRLTGANRARSAFIDDNRFAAREHPDVPGTLGGVAGAFTRAGMVRAIAESCVRRWKEGGVSW